jgi:hypothetical protein
MFADVAGIGFHEAFVYGWAKNGNAVIGVAVNPVHHAGECPLDAFNDGAFAEGAIAVGGVGDFLGLGHMGPFK